MLSVLIVNWNTKGMLCNCLDSLAAAEPPLPTEVIVVDNASTDGSPEAVRASYPRVTLIESGANLGYAEGNNLAFSRCQGDWILLLNPDTELGPDTLAVALQELAVRPGCACLSVKFFGPEGELQRSVRGFPTFAGVLGQLTGLDRLFPRSQLGSYSQRWFDYDREGYADQPMGTFLLFRRSALERVGAGDRLFDPSFPIFFNEVDLLYRLRAAGFDCWYTPKTSICHHHGASTRLVKRSMIWESHRSLVRYFFKHTQGVERLFLPLVAVASYTAAFIRAKGFHGGFRPQHHNL